MVQFFPSYQIKFCVVFFPPTCSANSWTRAAVGSSFGMIICAVFSQQSNKWYSGRGSAFIKCKWNVSGPNGRSNVNAKTRQSSNRIPALSIMARYWSFRAVLVLFLAIFVDIHLDRVTGRNRGRFRVHYIRFTRGRVVVAVPTNQTLEPAAVRNVNDAADLNDQSAIPVFLWIVRHRHQLIKTQPNTNKTPNTAIGQRSLKSCQICFILLLNFYCTHKFPKQDSKPQCQRICVIIRTKRNPETGNNEKQSVFTIFETAEHKTVRVNNFQ